jgi:hypothetical protein
MTLFEKMCSLLLALEHDLRTPVGVLKNDIGVLNTDGCNVERMGRQVERILGVIPPVERIMTEVSKGTILSGVTQEGISNSWFVDQIRSLGNALDGRTTRFSLTGADLEILFESERLSETGCELSGLKFSTFSGLFSALKSPPPSYVLIADAIVDHLGWTLSLRIE